ncbi:hypothetical protein VOLCADRAFT_98689 [Volvox carteri f. nagariensis]|uniref:JmjC domain-containing protein n=1 Tax=Volvox carteri f. nagariensis TaxID=3068 RepID=D8UG09_VOLCA|nr:uncharacterized protein VOLCADRAFT_98689 [Volvox carteri f. nagariensis]EFJ41348.1 hypothetical protein VOLCADRAFT_98689 [Volvox carteri f. nagariensis]|eukprot:XP_002957578.1 hypothetical protein VOLCADRAFT_98689 [Volvox carteri f. nagariensis]
MPRGSAWEAGQGRGLGLPLMPVHVVHDVRRSGGWFCSLAVHWRCCPRGGRHFLYQALISSGAVPPLLTALVEHLDVGREGAKWAEEKGPPEATTGTCGSRDHTGGGGGGLSETRRAGGPVDVVSERWRDDPQLPTVKRRRLAACGSGADPPVLPPLPPPSTWPSPGSWTDVGGIPLPLLLYGSSPQQHLPYHGHLHRVLLRRLRCPRLAEKLQLLLDLMLDEQTTAVQAGGLDGRKKGVSAAAASCPSLDIGGDGSNSGSFKVVRDGCSSDGAAAVGMNGVPPPPPPPPPSAPPIAQLQLQQDLDEVAEGEEPHLQLVGWRQAVAALPVAQQPPPPPPPPPAVLRDLASLVMLLADAAAAGAAAASGETVGAIAEPPESESGWMRRRDGAVRVGVVSPGEVDVVPERADRRLLPYVRQARSTILPYMVDRVDVDLVKGGSERFTATAVPTTAATAPPAAHSPPAGVATDWVAAPPPPLAPAADDMEWLLGLPAGANVYGSPPGRQGLAAHYDDHCVLVLQLQGAKEWLLQPPRLLPAQLLPLTYCPRLPLGPLGATATTTSTAHIGDTTYPVLLPSLRGIEAAAKSAPATAEGERWRAAPPQPPLHAHAYAVCGKQVEGTFSWQAVAHCAVALAAAAVRRQRQQPRQRWRQARGGAGEPRQCEPLVRSRRPDGPAEANHSSRLLGAAGGKGGEEKEAEEEEEEEEEGEEVAAAAEEAAAAEGEAAAAEGEEEEGTWRHVAAAAEAVEGSAGRGLPDPTLAAQVLLHAWLVHTTFTTTRPGPRLVLRKAAPLTALARAPTRTSSPPPPPPPLTVQPPRTTTAVQASAFSPASSAASASSAGPAAAASGALLQNLQRCLNPDLELDLSEDWEWGLDRPQGLREEHHRDRNPDSKSDCGRVLKIDPGSNRPDPRGEVAPAAPPPPPPAVVATRRLMWLLQQDWQRQQQHQVNQQDQEEQLQGHHHHHHHQDGDEALPKAQGRHNQEVVVGGGGGGGEGGVQEGGGGAECEDGGEGGVRGDSRCVWPCGGPLRAAFGELQRRQVGLMAAAATAPCGPYGVPYWLEWTIGLLKSRNGVSAQRAVLRGCSGGASLGGDGNSGGGGFGSGDGGNGDSGDGGCCAYGSNAAADVDDDPLWRRSRPAGVCRPVARGHEFLLAAGGRGGGLFGDAAAGEARPVGVAHLSGRNE